MSDEPFSTDDFGPAQRIALALAGTVALPSPPPASGRVFIGLNPSAEARSAPAQDHVTYALGLPRYFIRSVQTVSDQQSITRIFDLDELRAVKLPLSSVRSGKDEHSNILPAAEVAAEVDRIKRELEKLRPNGQAGVLEVLWYPEAVLFVPEAAPVFVRIQYELGLTAAEAAEHIASFPWMKKHCC